MRLSLDTSMLVVDVDVDVDVDAHLVGESCTSGRGLWKSRRCDG